METSAGDGQFLRSMVKVHRNGRTCFQNETRPSKVKRFLRTTAAFAGHFRAAHKLLSWWASAIVPSVLSRARDGHAASFIPSLGARLRHGRVAGANRIDRLLWRTSRFAPTPNGRDTARPTCP